MATSRLHVASMSSHVVRAGGGGGPRARALTTTHTTRGMLSTSTRSSPSSSRRRRRHGRDDIGAGVGAYGVKTRASSVESEQKPTIAEDVNEAELRRTLQGIGLELLDCVDKGSYAAVYKATSVGGGDVERTWLGEAGEVFAVKILLTSMMNEDSVRDFRREALLLGRVDHPGIIKMYHYGKTPQPFMVTEFCEGGNLWNAIRCEQVKVSSLRGGGGGGGGGGDTYDSNFWAGAGLEKVPENMPMLDIPAVATDVTRALAYLHSAGFAHRDIKSSNVLLTWCPKNRRVQAKLCDFGSAAPVSKMPRRPAWPIVYSHHLN